MRAIRLKLGPNVRLVSILAVFIITTCIFLKKSGFSQQSAYEPEKATSWDGRQITLVGRGVDENVPLPSYHIKEKRLGNYETVINKTGHTGPGEFGVSVSTLPSEEPAAKESIKHYGFNLVNSDKISMDRMPKDLRHEDCFYIDYPEKLPMVSVVIVFHNEGWGPLVRTFHSVVNRSPKELLGEIVVLDDGSDTVKNNHLGEKLQKYIDDTWHGVVKLYRNERREGLIRARSIGATHATFEVLVFLDAHCEASHNWLPPLLAPIARNDRISTVPLIDGLDGEHYTFSPQGGGDAWERAQGAWDWNFFWKRYPIPAQESAKFAQPTMPFPSPAMAGGLFAINRQYFYDIGMYDPGLEIWGGENFEIAFKLWMCGGGILFAPCSRVSHIYRMGGWDGNPPPEYVLDISQNPSHRNYRRVIEVWWDDWTKYFYTNRPELQFLDYGDVEPQKKFRHDHCPYSFDWMMKEVAYGLLERWPTTSPLVAWGEVRGVNSKLCIDTMGHNDDNGAAQLYYCHGQGGNQYFKIHEDGQMVLANLKCLYPDSSNGNLLILSCDSNTDSPKNGWKYNKKMKLITYKSRCLNRSNEKVAPADLTLEDCVEELVSQKWEINEVDFISNH